MTLKGQITSTTGAKARSARPSIGVARASNRGAGIGDDGFGIVDRALVGCARPAWSTWDLTCRSTLMRQDQCRAGPSRDDSRDNQIWVGPRFLTRRPSGGLRRADPVHGLSRVIGKRIKSICGGSEASRFASIFQAEILRLPYDGERAEPSPDRVNSTTRSWPARSRCTDVARPAATASLVTAPA